MSQYDFGTINPATKSGTALATDLNAWRTALNSMHKGNTRPTYAIAGTRWVDDTATPWIEKQFDGTDDLPVATINPTTNEYIPYVDAANVTFTQGGAGAIERDLVEKLGEFISVKDFGAIGDGVTDDTLAFSSAISSGRSIFIPDGEYIVDISSVSITLSPGTSFVGNGLSSIILLKNTSGVLKTGLRMSDNTAIRNLKIDVLTASDVYTDDTELVDTNKDFNYNQHIISIGSGNNESGYEVTGCFITRSWRGIDISDGNNIVISNNIIWQVAAWMTQFYNCNGLVFNSNVCKYGGGSGGVAASSVKHAVFSNNIIVSSGTGINPGGSSAVGYNVEDVVVSGNHVTARDTIVLENGAENVVVTGNRCIVLYDTVIGGSNGTGISVTSDSGGVFGGSIGNVNITGNNITNYNSAISMGVRVGSLAGSSENIFGVAINSNNVQGTSVGVYVFLSDATKVISDVVVSNNIIVAGRGIQVGNITKFQILGNICKNNLLADYGILVAGVYGSISKNKLCGYSYSVNLGVVDKVICDDNETLPGPSGTGSPILSNASYPSWCMKGSDAVITQTSTDINLLTQSTFTYYSPPSSIIIPGTVSGYAKKGEFYTFYFLNNNTTLQSASTLELKNGSSTNPAANTVITFVATSTNNLREISRSY